MSKVLVISPKVPDAFVQGVTEPALKRDQETDTGMWQEPLKSRDVFIDVGIPTVLDDTEIPGGKVLPQKTLDGPRA